MATKQAYVLVVDDEPDAARTTGELLRRAGYRVELALSGEEALRTVALEAPDLMLLDYEMPDLDGPDVLEQLQVAGGRLPFPVLFLTGARRAAADQVLGLDRGAADYILKGTDRQVLLARVKAAIRDRAAAADTSLRRGRLRVDMAANAAWLDDRRLTLERKPLAVLYCLALREGETLSRTDLLREVWQTNFKGFHHAVDQAVYSLRRQLGEPGWIETVHGRGYRFARRG